MAQTRYLLECFRPPLSGMGGMVLVISTYDNESSRTRKRRMVTIKKKGALWYLFRAPVCFYRWGLGWLFGHRLLMLSHTGRCTGLRHQTVLEVVEYRKQGPEVIVANGFGPNSDWVRNIKPSRTKRSASDRPVLGHLTAFSAKTKHQR